jgi:hypothetical protein
MVKLILVLFLATIASFAQPSGTPVIVSDGPPVEFFTRYVYTSGTATFVCAANHQNENSTITQSGISNAAAAVVSATSHGLHPEANPTVTVSGGTGSWAALNGTWTATYINSNSFSLPVNTTAFGAVAGTIVIKTNAPRTSRPVWVVQKAVNDTASGRQSSMTAVGGFRNVCDDRATLSYQ